MDHFQIFEKTISGVSYIYIKKLYNNESNKANHNKIFKLEQGQFEIDMWLLTPMFVFNNEFIFSWNFACSENSIFATCEHSKTKVAWRQIMSFAHMCVK